MAIDSRKDVLDVLRRFVRGEITTGELLRYVHGKDFGYLDELLERLELKTSDFAQIALAEDDLSRRLDSFFEGRISFRELGNWVHQLYRIYSCSEYQSSDHYCREIENGLLLLSLAVDLELTEGPYRSKRLIRIIHNSVRRHRPLPNELILRKLYGGKRRIHLMVREIGDAPGRPWRTRQWADIALLSRPCPSGGLDDDEACWFIPLSVCTSDFWLDLGPGGAWTHPENDKMIALRESYPQLSLDDVPARYFVDPDGLTEVVLDVEEIGDEDLKLAARLFCLHNRVRSCYLHGTRIYPTEEDR